MIDLATFSVEDKVQFASELRGCGSAAPTMQDAAACVARALYDGFSGEEGARACALVRVYRTVNFDHLDSQQAAFALRLLGGEPPTSSLKVLTLLASAGDLPEWNAVERSAGHRAIPLASEEMVRQSPMISQLLSQLGMEVSALLAPDPTLIRDLERREYNIFYVPVAQNSPCIPAQDEFVTPHRIKSAVGFGGQFATGDLFAVILFTKVHIPYDVAANFRTLALTVKTALLSAGVSKEAV